MRTVATAGHVDHGKSSLVLALTGTDPDRFPEERARGLTIDLGFAFCTLPSGTEVGFVDVPGHVRFVRNMLAGVGAVDVAVLVIAATEGWMPQTEEHLRILDVLGVAHGIVALTKADLVDDETLALAQLEVEEHLVGSGLADAAIVAVDSVSGRGLDDVRAALDTAIAAAPAARDVGRPRLWVDRVFAAKGAGTVVTGTLTGGALTVDEEVVVAPGAHAARVRRIESHGTRLERVEPGARVALNLAGVEHRDVHRGDAVVRPGQWSEPTLVDVALVALPDVTPRRRGRVQVHVGSGERGAWLRVLDDDGRFARLRLDTALPLAPGDRLVVRDAGRQATVAGAEVLDVAPARRAGDAPARLALPLGARVLADGAWRTDAELVPLVGLPADAARAVVLAAGAASTGDWLVAPATLTDLRARARDAVNAHHAREPLAPGFAVATLASSLGVEVAQLRAALADEPALVLERDVVRGTAHVGRASDSPEAQALVDALRAGGCAPPSPAELGASPTLVRALVREGLLVDLDGMVFAEDAIAEARQRVVDALADRGSLTVADLRDLLGSTRKFTLAIAAHLDATGVTRRRGDDRVPGPRSGLAGAGA